MHRQQWIGQPTSRKLHSRLSSPRICIRFLTQAIAQVSRESRGEYDRSEALRRQRKTEWKRRQGGQTFLDHLIVSVQGGRGGDGCVAFHREKFRPYGPPSGGSGGRGADVYIVPNPHLTTLSAIPKRIRGAPGGGGQGTWMNGRNAPPTIIQVPLGTVVRELSEEEARAARVHFRDDEEHLDGASPSEVREKMRASRWVHYPGAEADNLQRDAFKEAEQILYRQERDRRHERRQTSAPIVLDLDQPISSSSTTPLSADGALLPDERGFLVAAGGRGGIGNPAFLSTTNRSPKFATRGTDGQRVVLSLELKILADVGLVGFPNAGKSTLLRALTGGRSKTEVAEYAFTTLNPVVGVVRVGDDGGLLDDTGDAGRVIEDTKVEEQRHAEMMKRGEFSDALTRNQSSSPSNIDVWDAPGGGRDEAFRFTIADNPGLISRASENIGLGHSFLRSIERSLALVYVVDLSGPSPHQELKTLRDELEKYKPGLSLKARMVIANKADLLEGDAEQVEEAKAKLQNLEIFVKEEMRSVHPVKRRSINLDATAEDPAQAGDVLIEVGKELDVVPISAKFSQNLRKVTRTLRTCIEEARTLKVPR